MKKRNGFQWIVCLFIIVAMMAAMLPTAVFAASGTVIYFENTASWSTVNIYYWSDTNTSMVGWPGVAMEVEEGNVYAYRLPDGVTKVIFNNGTDQTEDLTVPTTENMYVYNSGWEVYTPACIHELDDGVVTTAATCTTDGVMTYTCTLCGDTETEVIKAAHNYVNGVCTVCGQSQKVIYFENTAGWSTVNIYYWSSADAAMIVWPGTAMTLVSGTLYSYAVPGEVEYVIFNNGKDQTEDLTIPEGKNLYTYDGDWSAYSTCDHQWDNGTVTTEPTCTTDGVLTITCTLCGETTTEIIDAEGHNYVDGVCSYCGLAEPCAEHTWNEGTVTQEATCWVPGVRTYTCTLCGETKTETIAAGHKFYVAQTIEPTCTASGKEIIKCTGCAYSMDKTLYKVDHTYVAGEVVAPTCTADGYTVGICDYCGATTQMNPVYHSGHKWSGNTCTVCGEVCNHNYVDGICASCHDGGPAYVEGYYEIANAAQLYWFAAQVNSGNNAINGRLIADIDLKGGIWTSIGYYCSDTLTPNTLAYSGTFDGQGHTVSNFTTAGTDNEGLFGYCSSATIMNVGVVNATVKGWRAGAVAGYALTSDVINCFAKDCTITGYTTNSVAMTSGTVYIAPVAGPQGGVVRNCYALNCTLLDNSDLDVYTAPVGGVDTQNGYYCNVQWTDEFSSVRNSTEVTMDQLTSGEVTYLLNKGVTDGTQGWYQTCGVGLPAHSGKTVYQVTGCADGSVTYSNETTAAGHNFVNGVCTNCGEADPDYVKPVTKPTLNLVSPALNFEDEIYYNIYYTVSDMTDVVEMGLITFNASTPDGTVENADAVIPGYVQSGANYMSHTNGIPAKMLGDALYFKAYAKLSDGSYVYSGMQGYHAVAYAKDILANSSNAKMKALVVAMLNYGAAAQVHFDYKTDALVNSFLTDDQKALIDAYSSDMVEGLTKVDTSKVGAFAGNGGYKGIAPNVVFEGAFAINLYFTAANSVDSNVKLYYWTLDDYNAAETLTAENATGVVITEETSTAGQYVGAITGIAAKQIDQTVFFCAVYESNGTSYCTGVFSYSLASYCLDRITNGSATMQEFAKETIVYGYYAKAYFA